MPKLTAEEKKQRKAEKKAKKLREAEELRIKTRKDELAREVQSSQNNVSTYMKEWYNRNYAARFPHIKEDMEVAWSNFEHAVDLKDFIIDELTEKMEEAKTQEAMSWHDYIMKMDDLIHGFHKRMTKLKEEFDEDVKNLLEEGQENREAQQRSQEELEDYYKTILFMMEEKFNEAMVVAQGEYLTKRDEESKRGTSHLEEMSGGLEKNLQTVIQEITDTIEDYKATTESRRKELEVLKGKDDYYNSMITRQDGKMGKLMDEMSALQLQLNEKHESRMALEDLKKDREETYAEYVLARTELSTFAALDEEQLLILSTESNNAIRDLERVLEKGEKILRLGNLCRRLETQEEKVMPFGSPPEDPDEIKDQQVEGSLLANFLRKFARANLIKRKLEPTLQELYQENNELRECLETAFEIMALTRIS